MATNDGADGSHLENEQYHLGRDSWFTEGEQRSYSTPTGKTLTVTLLSAKPYRG